MDAIRADYIPSPGQRIVCAGRQLNWANTVSALAPESSWWTDGKGRVMHGDGRAATTRFYPVPDSPEFRAYVLGTMPPYVFADYLEETVPDIDQRVLHLLRLPYRPEPVVTSGRNLGQD